MKYGSWKTETFIFIYIYTHMQGVWVIQCHPLNFFFIESVKNSEQSLVVHNLEIRIYTNTSEKKEPLLSTFDFFFIYEAS